MQQLWLELECHLQMPKREGDCPLSVIGFEYQHGSPGQGQVETLSCPYCSAYWHAWSPAARCRKWTVKKAAAKKWAWSQWCTRNCVFLPTLSMSEVQQFSCFCNMRIFLLCISHICILLQNDGLKPAIPFVSHSLRILQRNDKPCTQTFVKSHTLIVNVAYSQF